jgi:hypothetical protein
MAKRLDPNKAFPDEVLALRNHGVPLPAFFAGPLYTGNGTAEALEQLQRTRDAVRAHEADERPACA